MARKNYTETQSYTESWYQSSANRLIMTHGPLMEDAEYDVCIIGAGFTGLSAGIELIQQGMSVCIIEQNELSHSASAKSGGQVLRGYSLSPQDMIAKFGIDQTRFLQNLSLEGIALILDRIQNFKIECGLKFGHVTTAIKPRHLRGLKQQQKAWSKLGLDDLTLFDKEKIQSIVKTDRYIGGLFDPKGVHIHPLNYALGLAENFMKLGGKIYDKSRALVIKTKPTPYIQTKDGSIRAKSMILAGGIDVAGHDKITSSTIQCTTHMIATESLGEKTARKIMTEFYAISDCQFMPTHFRITNDFNLLFGHGCYYGNKSPDGEDTRLRAKMLKLFPLLRVTRIENFWHGPVYLTMNKIPQMGRLTPNVYFAHGFNGHGIVTANILGKVLAESVSGTMSRFDPFAKLPSPPITGGDAMKHPLFALGKFWYNLKDLM